MFNHFQIWRIKSFSLRLPSASPGLTTFNPKIVLPQRCVLPPISVLRVEIPNAEINKFLNLNGEKVCEAGPGIKQWASYLHTLFSFPLLLNSHASSFPAFKPIPPTFVLYSCLYDRCGSTSWSPAKFFFPRIHVAVEHLSIPPSFIKQRICHIDGVVLAPKISKMLQMK